MEVKSVEGVIVSSIPYKESSKILNILTKDYGLIGVISKGCKTIKSNLRNTSENFTYAIFHIYYKEEGLSILIGADIINYFKNIKSSITLIAYLSYLSEFAHNVYKQSENESIYNLFIASVLKIENGFNPMVITNILELKYLDYLGISLNLDECVSCGNTSVVTLSPYKGGYICKKCIKNEPIIGEKTLKMLRMYYYVDISKITELNINEQIVKEIDKILSNYYDHFTGLYIKSKKFLDDMK